MNTDQLFGGKLANGDQMPDYSQTSVERFGKRPGPYQLFETGDFYRGFFLDTRKFPVVFSSRDRKTGSIMDLIESKGQDANEIFGLNRENFKEIARVYTLEDLQDFLRKIIRVR